MLSKKYFTLLLLPIIFSCRSIELPKKRSKEIKTLSNVMLNFSSRINRDIFYAFFSSIGLELPEYISKDFKMRVYEEDGTRIELFRKKGSKEKKLMIIANGAAFVTPYRVDRREYFNNLFRDLDFDFIMVDYKMGVNRRFPVQNMDYINAYKLALKLGYSPNKIVFFGDSSGGNIVASTTVYLVDNELPTPQAVVMLSPYLDASDSVKSRERNLRKDVLFGVAEGSDNPPKFQNNLPYFAALKDLKNRYASPIYADNMSKFPSTLIHVGGYEILEDDSIKMYEMLKRYNVDVNLHVFDGLVHVFHILDIPESEIALKEVIDFAENKVKESGEEIKVNKDVINKIKFDVTLEEYSQNEVIEKYNKLGVDFEKYLEFEKNSYSNTTRRYLRD
ncbi:alpha/beta hydrolase fold domain-containing protein [Pseudostreptobacillus hongkongensis]|uniref:alpha/beta hydrolase fold domain-containing protein n=1 Tax=Pseudostreptobacillus hongkongensis TaxID=1162717 RepID=UPI000829F14B|nr:alpha/beta hydrolase [Pseudostreptobacillus hongkongensis]